MRDPSQQAAPAPRGCASRRGVLLLVAASLLIQLALIDHLDGRVYKDVVRSVDFGLGVEQGLISVRTHVDNTRSFLGPVLNAAAFRVAGPSGIRCANLLLFTALLLVAARVGGEFESRRARMVGLALLAFYAGAHRNVAAGELEDNLASLLFALALLAHLRGTRTFAVALGMGFAILIKFSVVIFVGGFGLHLLLRRRWLGAIELAAGAALPMLLLGIVDHGATVRSLLLTIDRQRGYSSWRLVGFRLLSTGLLPTLLASIWAWRRRPAAPRGLFLTLLASYFVYVVAFRDAHAVSFVMMLCLVPAGFLIAEVLVDLAAATATTRAGQNRLLIVLVAGYALVNAGIAWQNLYRDANPFRVEPGRGAKPIAELGDESRAA